MRSTLVSAALLGAALLGVSHSAAAQGYVEVGGFDSYTRFDRTLPWNTANSGGVRLSLGSGDGLGTFVLEGEAAYFSLKSPGPVTTQVIPSRARLLYTPTIGRVSLMMGGGAVRNDYITKTTPASPRQVGYGYTSLAGLRLAMGNFMTLRVEGVLDYLTHPVNASAGVKRNTNRSLQAGLSFPLWAERAAPRERPAEVAAAPAPATAPAPAPVVAAAPAREESRASHPDADRDGVADERDMCSGTAAGSTVDASGCAVYRDSDSDGVIDPRDACPASAGSDFVDGRGCAVARDSDDDGVVDTRDRCANTPAGTPVNSVGCEDRKAPAYSAAPPAPPAPDADADGVPDARDGCPGTEAGARVDATGCPVQLFTDKRRTVALRGVNFAPARDELTPGSLAVLDDVAQQLNEAPNVKIEIGGHTDSRGTYARNLRLSLARAEAVRAYLIMRGVDGTRLVARGYGMAKPLTSNATVQGRALNRRVELKRVD